MLEAYGSVCPYNYLLIFLVTTWKYICLQGNCIGIVIKKKKKAVKLGYIFLVLIAWCDGSDFAYH